MALRDLQEVDAAQLRQSAISVLVCGIGFEEVALHHEGAVEHDDDDSDLVPAYRADEATITGMCCKCIGDYRIIDATVVVMSMLTNAYTSS